MDQAQTTSVPVSPSDLTVIIPAHNEGQSIASVIAELRGSLPEASVLVVDDASTDDTAQQARGAGATVISHRRNRGYGAALKTGMRTATTTFVAMYDGDGQHRPDDLVRMLGVAGDFDMVIGSRDRDSHVVASRRTGKWLLGKVANVLVGQHIPDLNSGLRVIRREVILRYLHLLPDGFSASSTSTVCLLQRGYDVSFVPITTLKRETGQSRVRKVRDGLNTIRLIVRLIILFRPERFFLPPAAVLLAGGLLYGGILAIVRGRGFPVAGAVVAFAGFFMALFGVLADQISTLRLELFERDAPASRRL